MHVEFLTCIKYAHYEVTVIYTPLNLGVRAL